MLTSKQPQAAGVRCVCVLVHNREREREREEVKNESVSKQLQVYVCRITIVRNIGVSSIT